MQPHLFGPKPCSSLKYNPSRQTDENCTKNGQNRLPLVRLSHVVTSMAVSGQMRIIQCGVANSVLHGEIMVALMDESDFVNKVELYINYITIGT